MGGDGSASFWLSYDGAIQVRDCAGECVAGIDSAGIRYLSMHHIDSEITIRTVATGDVLARCETDQIAGLAESRPYTVDFQAALLDDEHVLVAIEADGDGDGDGDGDEFEYHVLVSTRTLATVDRVDYGRPLSGGSICGPGRPGHWLTFDWRTNTASVWATAADG